ncbi:DegT/DnrJ/EryC1/StrS aminotransferase family protein [Aestuariirhabdus sp. Z084]|uniref:DegT/DnrJ/EryC1/StrS family aminotransferase n=1 Tax=Aestuariirhabdus haliotis TaxID=2918751 RepID=UPI0020BD5B9D|nr:DegT/DnrJ/EryC1/StrS aminotransferase family protein [Aestuariirhabdus haliotis]MCL6415811.1 DegT/DnrJ/EryC1/StrS aminotransferase family protein [Aestuariirhabdus haliotis]
MLNTPFSPWPSFSEEEIAAVSRVLQSGKVNYWTGTEGREFEKEFARFTDSRYAVAVSNGTVALDLALHALGIGFGDEVIVTSRTFLASVSSIVLAGATPVFADVDRDSQNITAYTIKPLLSDKTKAIVCVHLAGWPCDMDPILELAREHEVSIIEDCAQAHGARYKGKSVGSLGDIAAWSFCQDKIMTTGGEGGMVTTNRKDLWQKVWSYKDHGKSWEAVYERNLPPGFRWLHESFGTNMRMTEMQAAIGRIQLIRMPEWRQRRQYASKSINEVASSYSSIRTPKPGYDIEHACYKHYLFIEPNNLKKGWDRDRIISELVNMGVPCYQGSCSEVYLEACFEGTGFRPEERLPVARELAETSLMFLVHPTLNNDEIAQTCKALKWVFDKASL